MKQTNIERIDEHRPRAGESVAGELNELRRRMVGELEAFLARAMKEPARRWIALRPRGYRVAACRV